MQEVERFAAHGGAVPGICNRFQILCKAGLLAAAPGDRLSVPAKHTTGRYWAPDPVLDELEDAGQVVLRYAVGHNLNGSARDIAGVCNHAGNVVGLMPHPEHAVDVLTGSTDGLKVLAAA